MMRRCIQDGHVRFLCNEIIHGHLECLRQTPTNLLRMHSDQAFAVCFSWGQLECIQLLYERLRAWGQAPYMPVYVPITIPVTGVTTTAHEALHVRRLVVGLSVQCRVQDILATLRYGFDHGCPWNEHCCWILFDGCMGFSDGPHQPSRLPACTNCKEWCTVRGDVIPTLREFMPSDLVQVIWSLLVQQ